MNKSAHKTQTTVQAIATNATSSDLILVTAGNAYTATVVQ
jgi:phosphoribosylcarboxyaminoimidazole (NCAIR) mutase